MWKKWLILFTWCLLGIATIVLLVAARQKKEHKDITDIRIEIEGTAEDHVFVDEKEVLLFLQKMGVQQGTEISRVNTRHLEEGLQRNSWIKKIDLFFDNNQVLQVKIEEREPVARVFTLQGTSFYIDSSGKRLPLSDKLSARVPVFTSFPSANAKLSAPDSAVLADVKRIAQFIQQDSFWMAQVSQVDITPQRQFEMIPVLGNQVIALGDADSLETKFEKLYGFYKQVWAKAGFEKYERVDVQYNGQVVATRRGAAKPFADSSKAMQQLQLTGSISDMKALMKDTLYAAEVNKHITLSAKDSAALLKAKAKPKAKPKPKAVMKKGKGFK